MFRALIVLAIVFAVSAFIPSSRYVTSTKLSMSTQKPSLQKYLGAAVVVSSLFGGLPSFAKEGAPANIGIFNEAPLSSPFVGDEKREDPIYSPYSPYGNGEAAAYNKRKGSAEEIKFWNAKFETGTSKISAVPKFVSKKSWMDINSALTAYAYDLREAGNRLAASSKNPTAASAAAKAYYQDLEDIMVEAKLKDGAKVLASFEKSTKDLAAFKALLK